MEKSKEDINIYHKRNILEKKQQENAEKIRRQRRNKGLLICIVLLIVLSSLNMLSASFYKIYIEGIGVFHRYLFFLGIGIIGYLVTGSVINYKFYNKNRFNAFVFIVSIILFIFIIVGSNIMPTIVPRINGAIGWIRVGPVSLQPAEFLKLPFIILIAHLLEKSEIEKRKNLRIIIPLLPVILIFGGFILGQHDLGTVIHYTLIFCFMLFMTKIDMKIIVGIIITGITGAFGMFGYVHSLGDVSDKGYMIKRVASFINGLLKNEYDNVIGYQVGQSLIAFGSGGFMGKGYANGVQKYSYIPEIRTDFILASYGEEFGFFGMILLMLFFFLIFNLIKRTAMECKDYFGKYLAIGIGGYLITQVLINIYVALGMLPVFGIPMPIFSYGGSSLITVFSALGIIGNINSHQD